VATLAPAYAPRRPTETALYGIVRDNLETFLSWARETYAKPLPRYVEQELRAYLRCGVFAHGFVHCRCDDCGHDILVAFSCKQRGACPSCAGRRMANTTAHLVDPTLADLDAIVRRVRDRALVWLRRRGLLDERPLEERSNEAPEPAALDGCAAIAMYRGTLAMLPASEDEAEVRSSDTDNVGAARPAFAVERDGFNLHASVRIEAGDDLGRERLCRYAARPPLSLERLRRLSGGRVAYRVKYVSRGRAKHRVMTSVELLARLSALLPPPRYPLTR
jgi:hypothetical protein